MPIVSGVKVDLTQEEIEKVKELLGREPSEVEIGMIDTLWSEHCSYKSSKAVLKLLPSEGSRVVLGPGQDAGAVDIGDGYAIVFKIESHNHPSAIDPYNGSATGIGGIIRDILCMGARPIALLDALRFGSIKDSHTRWLLRYVVKGIADYGNRTGIPTVAGEVQFDESFSVNCLVNVACIGIVKHERIIPSKMCHPGDYILLVGGLTGRDGLHGVTFASRTLSETCEEDRSAIQIGDPFLKKVLIDATLDAIATGYVHGLKDLGGGGLACASSEMASLGGVGAELWLEKVKLRERGMTPFEIMLSESQERMLFVVDQNGLSEVTKIFEKYDLPYSIIGRVTSTKKLIVKYNDEVVADICPDILTNAPIVHRASRKPSYIEMLRKVPDPPMPSDLKQVLYKLLASPNIASKEWIYRQYDHEVGIRTVVKPGDADAAVLRILEVPNKAIAVKTDCNSRHCYLDPYNGHAGAVAESARNVTAVGAEPIAMVDGCNFGNPENPEVFWQFTESIRGISDMCRALGIPCVGGNVSFYNEDERTGKAVKPTVIILMLGLIENLDWITTLSLKEPEDVIIAIGKTYPELGGSEYYYEIHGIEGGRPPKASPAREIASMKTVAESIRSGFLTAAHDCSKGGIAIAIAEMAMKGGLGIDVDVRRIPASRMRIDKLLFSESYARFIVTCKKEDVDKVLKIAKKNAAPASVIGRVTNDDQFTLRRGDEVILQCSVNEMLEIWSKALPEIMSKP